MLVGERDRKLAIEGKELAVGGWHWRMVDGRLQLESVDWRVLLRGWWINVDMSEDGG